MRKILIAALALLALLFLGRLLLPLFFVPSSHSARAEAKRPSVRVATVQLAQLRPQLPLVAKLQALQSILVTPEVSGRITALPDAQGGEVAAGARLIQLDDAQQRAALTEAEAFLRNEQRKLRDLTRLASKGVVTQNDLEGQSAAVAQAVARRDIARVEVIQRQLLAPFAGRVGLFDVSLGALVTPGEALLHLDDLASMRLDLAVPERYLAQLQLGAKLQAYGAAWPKQPLTGEIVAIDSRVDDESLTVKVRVRFANPDRRLLPGMLLQVALPFASERLPLIPMQAVEFQGAQRFVYLLDDAERVERRAVVLGEAQGSQVSVISGLQGGERLVVEGVVALKEGMRVQVMKADAPAEQSEEPAP